MNYPSKAPPIPTGELSETIRITPFEVTSITFVPNQTIGTVTFSDASTDDVKPSYGPFLDNVSLKSICAYADLRLDSGNDGKRMDSANSNKIDSFDNTMEDEAIGYVLEMGTSGDVEINFGISTGWPTDDLFIRLVEAVENEEDRILDFVEFDVPLSEFSSGGLWEITAKALPKSQTTQLRLEIYTTINGEELILSEDTATVTVSLFEMREIVKNKAGNGVYGRVVNFGQPLLPSDDRSHMWTSDLTTETHQTPRNGGDDGESYLKSALSYENGFDMECQYAFLHEEDGYGDQYGYVQAVDKDRANPLKKKYSFVANGGIKFGSIGGAGDSVFEATLLDVQAMIDKAMAELGMQSLDSSIVVNGNLRVPLTGYENSESINRLLNGIAYGQPLENIFIDDALCGTDAYSYLLRAYEYASYFGTSGSMRIITTGADTSENSWTYGDISIITNGMQTYNSDPWNEGTVLPLPVRNQQNEDGKPILNNNQKPIKEKYFDSRIYLQSHWGSGVRYTAITIEDNPEGGE
ncbi:MAG: hypothetical protein Q4C70_04255 [Planctomycetia bacterium]|nr:hypothetical protein [Planctomycetia bacterium]